MARYGPPQLKSMDYKGKGASQSAGKACPALLPLWRRGQWARLTHACYTVECFCQGSFNNNLCDGLYIIIVLFCNKNIPQGDSPFSRLLMDV